MKGFGHVTWAGAIYNILIAIMTMILLSVSRTEFLWVAIGLSAGALILQNWQAMWYRAYRDKETKNKEFYKKLSEISKLIITALMTISALILMIFHIGLMYNGLPNFHFGMVFGGYILATEVAINADKDFTIGGVRAHRDPFTHSASIGSLLAFFFIFFLEGDALIVCILGFGICTGMMMHLFCDIVPEGRNGLQAIVAFFKWKESPGDIRGIRESCEQPWLLINGSILGFFGILSILRSLTTKAEFPAVWGMGGWGFTALSQALFVTSIILLILPFVLRVLFRDKK
jgi:hypothetical protein